MFIYKFTSLCTCSYGTNMHLARHGGSRATASDASNGFFIDETAAYMRVLGYLKLRSDWLLKTPPSNCDVILLHQLKYVYDVTQCLFWQATLVTIMLQRLMIITIEIQGFYLLFRSFLENCCLWILSPLKRSYFISNHSKI